MALFSVSYVFQLFQCLFSLSFGTAADTVSACPPPTAPLTIYFQKPAAWPNAKIYYWGETPTGTMPDVTWPGVNMTLMQGGCGCYYFIFHVNGGLNSPALRLALSGDTCVSPARCATSSALYRPATSDSTRETVAWIQAR